MPLAAAALRFAHRPLCSSQLATLRPSPSGPNMSHPERSSEAAKPGSRATASTSSRPRRRRRRPDERRSPRSPRAVRVVHPQVLAAAPVELEVQLDLADRGQVPERRPVRVGALEPPEVIERLRVTALRPLLDAADRGLVEAAVRVGQPVPLVRLPDVPVVLLVRLSRAWVCHAEAHVEDEPPVLLEAARRDRAGPCTCRPGCRT